METLPKVIVVLVNWNGLADTLVCLHSLEGVTYPDMRIVVVDNGSKADEAPAIRHAYPDIDVLRSDINSGFTGGNNIGIEYALHQGADYVLCLNNDTVVAPDFLTLMIEAIEADTKAGIVTASIYEFENPGCLMVSGCRVDYNLSPPVAHNAPPSSVSKTMGNVILVPFAEGCVLMMRRQVAEQIKGFDDDFFAYLEDADLCLRASANNWHCLLAVNAVVWHKVRRPEAGYMSPAAIYYSFRNGRRLVKKHATAWEQKSYDRIERIGLMLHWRDYFRDLVRDGNISTLQPQKSLLPHTVGVISGRLNLTGANAQYRGIEAVLNAITLAILFPIQVYAKMLHPLYRARCKWRDMALMQHWKSEP